MECNEHKLLCELIPMSIAKLSPEEFGEFPGLSSRNFVEIPEGKKILLYLTLQNP